MKKDTTYLLGGVALVGLLYYLYSKKTSTTANDTSNFANAGGVIGGDCCVNKRCPPGTLCQTWYTQTTPTMRMKHCGCSGYDMRTK